eukprot:4658596-Pleurochrysis_carterae.AAC.1
MYRVTKALRKRYEGPCNPSLGRSFVTVCYKLSASKPSSNLASNFTVYSRWRAVAITDTVAREDGATEKEKPA